MVTQPGQSACTDRVAIVTGGSRGVGLEVALELAARGYAVVVDYARDQAAADGVVEDVLARNGTALAVRGDVTDELDVERLFTETNEAFGGVDVVVHAVGRSIPGPIADYDLALFDALLRTNVRGTFIVNRQAAHEVRDGGAIVNVSGSLVRGDHAFSGAHVAASAAVRAITRALARVSSEAATSP